MSHPVHREIPPETGIHAEPQRVIGVELIPAFQTKKKKKKRSRKSPKSSPTLIFSRYSFGLPMQLLQLLLILNLLFSGADVYCQRSTDVL